MIAKARAWAIATTSSGQSWSFGVPDGNRLGIDVVLGNVRWIVTAIDLPVSAGIESGWPATPEDRRATTARFLRADVVGVNVEDSGAADGGL